MVAAKGDDARVFVSNQIILGARRKSVHSVNRHSYKNHEMEINTRYNFNSKDNYRIN